MKPVLRKAVIALAAVGLITGTLIAGTGLAMAGATQVTLNGSQEVPPVQTAATGNGTITVNDDKSVSGSVTTKGVKGTMAHIHEAAPGQNGGVAIPLRMLPKWGPHVAAFLPGRYAAVVLRVGSIATSAATRC